MHAIQRTSRFVPLQFHDIFDINMKVELKESMVSIATRLEVLTVDAKQAYILMEKMEQVRHFVPPPAIADDKLKQISVRKF